MPDREEAIKQKLEDRFDFMRDKCAVRRERRLWAEAPGDKLAEVAAYLKNELGFDSLCTITALDSGENYEMIYHLANGGIVMNLKAFAPKSDPVFDTVTGLYEGATMYELEAHNLLGLRVRGIPEEIRYPLPDDWPEGQYPLRKDWSKEPAEGGQGDGQ
jgi:Ni,Fe-hydrogenase III component G